MNSTAQVTATDVSGIENSVAAEVARACRTALGDSLLALVLTGSLARHEGSFARCDGGWTLVGDADFLAVLKETERDPGSEIAVRIGKDAEAALAVRGIRAHISVGLVSPVFLRKLQPHIFAYELSECGQVVEGDAGVLSLVPAFSASDIPQEDAFRLLCNRIIEQLSLVQALQGSPDELPAAFKYGILKLSLDMATSLLLFAGRYAPSYRARLARLREISQQRDLDLPFEMGAFCDHVALFTRMKLQPGDMPFTLADCRMMLDYASRLWAWEVERLRPRQRGFAWLVRGTDGVGCESFMQWLRGWLRVLRHQQRQRSWRSWARWLRLCCQSSPRYLVYSVAARVMSVGLDSVQNPDTNPARIAGLRQRLPLHLEQNPDEGYLQLIHDIAYNYQELLVDTRS